MSKVYLTCFEFNLGPISAYKRSVTPTHWQKMRNLQGSKKSEIHFFEPWKFLSFYQCVGVEDLLYSLIRSRVNSKHVKYTLNMSSDYGKHLKKVSRKKIICIFDTGNPFFGHPKFRKFLVSATTS